MMIADCHLHSEFSFDSSTPVTAQIEKAISLGMKHMCFTDHMDMDFPKEGEFFLETDAYVKKILEMKERYKDKIKICVGVELGLQTHLQQRLNDYIDQYPFDFVIGSMHLLHGEDPYYGAIFKRMGDEEAYREYFLETYKNLLAAPKIHTLGHLDYVVRYGKEKDKCYSYKKYADEIDAILQLLIEKGIALEVNTAGLRMLGFTNPHQDIIKRYRELGGEMITIGSDGHLPEYLGYGFERLPEYLKACGFKYYIVFVEKKPQFMVI